MLKTRFWFGLGCLWVLNFSFVYAVNAQKNHATTAQNKIDRFALISRHNAHVNTFDTMASLSVGNGGFAFTVDPTGLQTFPSLYENGIPLGTESEWGWHSFPNPNHFSTDDVREDFRVHDRLVPYVSSFKTPKMKEEATNWLRENPHRLNLGTIGWTTSDASLQKSDIGNPDQELNLWKGEISSSFSVRNSPVRVKTICHPDKDQIAVSATSSLFKKGELGVRIRFSYGSGSWDDANDWNSPDKHETKIIGQSANRVLFLRILDTSRYYVEVRWEGKADLKQIGKHDFELFPAGSDRFSFTCLFSQKPEASKDNFSRIEQKNVASWKNYWMTGGVVDLSGSTDPRAEELERRIVLSQYLTRIQDAGIYPPQETGLTYNSWYGKFHLEMHYWHEAHFALWNHSGLLKRSLPWYHQIAGKARETARLQGYKGVRWPKMTDPTGRESPSPIGPFLIWQEPHIINMLELCYRDHPDRDFLEKYKDLVFETADFMASYPWYDPVKKEYVLGPALIPAQERFNRDSTINPTFELAYWYWGLSIAQKWRERLGLLRDAGWDSVMQHLSPLPVLNGVYLAAQSFPDTYTNPDYTTDHPSMLMALGFVPHTPLADSATMRRTLQKVLQVWDWDGTWGWDYPMVAMTATRLGMPEEALNVLMMEVTKNTYLPNGHNYQRSNLRAYLPGNGSLLLAVALMCAGWDGYDGPPNPGFPKDGKWKVRWENIRPMP